MFERRLKIIFCMLALVSLLLLGRVFAVQVVGHSYWAGQTSNLLTRPVITETTRGAIYDIKGRLLAEDVACTDACVDYRAITDPPDPVWITELANARLKNRLGAEYRKPPTNRKPATEKEKNALKLEQLEEKQLRVEVVTMWKTLAELYQPTDGNPDVDRAKAMDDIRRGIIQTVEARRQDFRARTLQHAVARASASSKWVRWIFSSSNGDAPIADDPVIEEQKQPHVILHALDSAGCNFLGKKLEDFPGLSLRASTHRWYPMKTVAAHLLGRMSRVSAADLKLASQRGQDDGRQYLPNDTIGRDGAEALCEPLLRGARGKIEKEVGTGTIINEIPFKPGCDARLSIDSHLQELVQNMLEHVRMELDNKLITPEGGVSMHAAAVVLDVKTNEVRVLASNPGFDVNDLETRYTTLVRDTVNEPLRNRATSDEFEPGSTAKPMLGLGAITQGVVGPHEGIECTGYLLLPVIGPDGKFTSRKIQMPTGRCWVASEYKIQLNGNVAHHPVPYPHRGIYGNPDGFLTYSDALERSCNVYFETVADRLGPEGVDHWYEQFGFGQPTGIGIFERPGRRPSQFPVPFRDARMANCYTGIGQGNAWATPLQVANEAATIARGGIWMRPRLLTTDTQQKLDAAHQGPSNHPVDSVDLHLDAEALRQARIGMANVVTKGTGKIDCPDGITVAAKTGTADGSRLWITTRDADGKSITQPLAPVIRGGPETNTPWYRSDEKGKTEVHAWYMGFAPVEHPQIAFCVMVEYAGAGGVIAAGPIASHILEACVQDGYLHADQ